MDTVPAALLALLLAVLPARAVLCLVVIALAAVLVAIWREFFGE